MMVNRHPPLEDSLAEILGLHLNGDGYRIVFEGLMRLIIDTWPDQNPYTMPHSVRLPWELALNF